MEHADYKKITASSLKGVNSVVIDYQELRFQLKLN
jgi:hypothetical protein